MKEKKHKERSRNALVWFAVFIPVACLAAVTGISGYNAYRISSVIQGLQADREALEALSALYSYSNVESMLSAGIAIIGMAVSVWIGLNIYNVFKRDEIQSEIRDELKDEFSKDFSAYTGETSEMIRSSSDELEKGIGMISGTVEENRRVVSAEIKKLAFMNELSKTFDSYNEHESKYLYDLFAESRDDESETYAELEEIERRYVYLCKLYHENKSSMAYRYSHELYKDLKKIENRDYISANGVLCSKAVKLYINSRITDTQFYMIVLQSKVKEAGDSGRFEELSSHAEYCVEHISPRFRLDMSRPGDISTVDNLDDDQARMLASFFSRYGYAQHIIDGSADAGIIPLEIATDLDGTSATYYHNLGVCYERKWINAEPQNKRAAYEQTRRTYEKAIAADPMDYKAYNNLGAMILKRIDKEHVDPIRFNSEGAAVTLFSDIRFESFREADRLKDDIHDAILYFEIAMSLSPSFEDAYYNAAKAYFYLYMLECRKNSVDLNHAMFLLRKVETLNPRNIGYHYILRNIYEVTDQDSAFKENELLLTRGGDAQRVKKLYLKEKGIIQ